MRKHLLLLMSIVPAFYIAYAQVSPDKALKSLTWRAIGPANMGGRVTDIVGIPGDPSTFYVAGADGGVFKTVNGGVTFEALFTDQRAFSVGALAIAPSDPNVIWLGSGEGDPRNSVGYGNGVYRSLDAGKNWKYLGLPNTERIKRIVVNSNNPDEACICALGHAWGANKDRGVYKTVDGGANWDKVLYLDENTGCSDIAMEAGNPRIMYAGMWTFRRKPWRFDDGGGQTALYRTLDGGKTWEKSTKGLPEGPMARIGVAVAQSSPNIVYMITEFPNASGTLFRSEDRGVSWKLVNKDPNINFRPFYYSDIRVDPNNPDVIYSLSGPLNKSTDGGKTFRRIANEVHGDHQGLWIDPQNSQRILNGSDGGYQVSYDAGLTWDIINNVELSQFYQMYIDNQDPYYIYGGLQDNGTWFGPSNSLHVSGIMKRHWKQIASGDGYYAVPIPGSEHEVYANLQGGVIFHVDTRTGNIRNIHPYPKIIGSAGDAVSEHKYRFNWDSPITISPHDPNVVYFGGNVLFRSDDKGKTWKEISPDLTTNDKSKQQSSGGSVYQDNTAAEFHCTILYIAESPKQAGVIWAGTDDGNVQVTRDGGKTWTNVAPMIKGLPQAAWVAKIHASEHDAGTAFVAVDQHRMDDFRPYVYMTADYGKTWTNLSAGLPVDDYVKVIRQDPFNPNLLYVGMEHGLYASWDKGKSWVRINNNLPPASVTDIRVHPRERDLVVATHGRGVWILDDARPLQEWNTAMGQAVKLFEVRPATRWHMYSLMEDLGEREYTAKNPAYGAYINYSLAQDAKDVVTLDIVDAQGKTVRTLRDSSAKAGLNRMVWDLRYDGPARLNTPIRSGWGEGPGGPKVPPGSYTAKLNAGGQSLSTTIVVKADPRVNLSTQDYQAQNEAALSLQELQNQAHRVMNETERISKQLKELKDKVQGVQELDPSVKTDIESAQKKLEELLNEMRRPAPNMSYRQKPQLREEIRSLLNAIDGASAAPTQAQLSRINELKQETGQKTAAYEQILQNDINSINRKVQNLPQIVTDTRKM